MTIKGRVWKFGDNISTDLMLPGPALALSEKEQMKWVFQANRPTWLGEIAPGDIIIGGRGYGVGSGRPAARSLRNLGIGCLIAESINRLFFRNCVNYGFPALECAGIATEFQEGQIAEVSVEEFTVRNLTTNKVYKATPVPEMLRSIMFGGGLYPTLERNGYIAPKVATA